MAPLSLKIILDEGAVTRTVKFDSRTKVQDVYPIIKEKVVNLDDSKEYGLFLTSADNPHSGVWLEASRPLEYYMLRDGDSLLYLRRSRNLRVRMLDGSLKTLEVDEAKNIGDLMITICEKIGITNHDEYGLCQEEIPELEELKDQKPTTGTLTLKRRKQERERDSKMDILSKKLKTDDNVEWLDQHQTLREMGVDPGQTLLLKRRLFYSDRNVDSRDPVQLNLLYVQTRDNILNGRHPITEEQAKVCRGRWTSMRDENRRRVKQSLYNTSEKIRLYRHEAEMSFLRPTFKDVLLPDSDEDDEDEDNGNDNVAEVADENSDAGHSKRKRRRLTNGNENDDGNENDGSNENEQQKTPSNNVVTFFDAKDPVDAFLIGVGTMLKRLRPFYLKRAKKKIATLVQEIECKQMKHQEMIFLKCSTGNG